jgi:hypothetical protein
LDYAEALKTLEHLRGLIDRQLPQMYASSAERKALSKEISEIYRELEGLIERFVGRSEIIVPAVKSGTPASLHPNFIAAGFLSGRTIHVQEGYLQLTKIIGEVRRLAKESSVSREERSLDALVHTLRRFRECCQYLCEAPSCERDVQEIAWIMLRSQFDRVEREDSLPMFAARSFKPNLGVPELQTLIDVRFVGKRTNVSQVEEEILSDAAGYLADQSRYDSLIILVYDAAHRLRGPRKSVEDLRSIDGMIDVIVIPGVG